MALITGGRVNRFLTKYLGVKGEVVAPEVGPEVHPVIQVTGLPFELRALDDVKSYTYTFDNTGDATHPALFILTNPATSNRLVVLETVYAWYYNAVGDYLKWKLDAITFGGTGGNPRDWRTGGGAQTSGAKATLLTGNAPPSSMLDLPYISTPFAGVQLHMPVNSCGQQMVLSPGVNLFIATRNNAERLTVMAYWWERALEPSELSG